MDIRLFFEKIYWNLRKRSPLKKQKTYEDWAAKGYLNTPKVSFIIQSHNKSTTVCYIVEQLRNYLNAEIIVIDDGSQSHHAKRLTRFLTGGNEFLIRANDLYENVMYDKAIRFANGSYIVLLQDDDKIAGTDWVDAAIKYFTQYPDMAILGGRDGLDFHIDEEGKWGYDSAYKTPHKNANFHFVHIVNRAPMILNKKLFTEHLKHIDFSFAPFQADDIELCLRAWLSGLKVGWYDAGFNSLLAGGMRIWNNEFTGFQGQKNAAKLYAMYKTHTDEITRKVEKANEDL